MEWAVAGYVLRTVTLYLFDREFFLPFSISHFVSTCIRLSY